ncbi:hypothetical protein CC78DRAFT_581844 [Lojkania enalia]|uniref:Uncharacterized protein n=1 Tax=Lojkania enalia TaxID=147567 RepID=A0A9P4K559_9PLEO|nr:hypothetical protein CC78DRAFT_581844 [Didymosphaeria enalia]
MSERDGRTGTDAGFAPLLAHRSVSTSAHAPIPYKAPTRKHRISDWRLHATSRSSQHDLRSEDPGVIGRGAHGAATNPGKRLSMHSIALMWDTGRNLVAGVLAVTALLWGLQTSDGQTMECRRLFVGKEWCDIMSLSALCDISSDMVRKV